MNNRFVRRKWGWYLTLLDREHFKVKLLRFYKGGKCSLQKHTHRNELWLFLSGEGHFSGGRNASKTMEGEWQLVKAGELHDFWALFKPALILEIQYGDKCEESDIVRV